MGYGVDGRATGFGEIARAYDRARPGYPAALFDRIESELLALAGARVLEVGSGTGIATAELLRRGAVVAAVEPDPRMAAVLRGKVSLAQVYELRFEQLLLPRSSFDLVVAAQSWHWVRQRDGLRKVSLLLREGGFFVAFWNLGSVCDTRLSASILEAFSRIKREIPVLLRPRDLRKRIGSIERSLALASELLPARRFEFTEVVNYSREAFIDLLGTMSDVLALAPGLRPGVLAEIGSAAPVEVAVEYRTVMLCAARG